MKNNAHSGNLNHVGVDSSLQFKALDEIVSMIQSLTTMMNHNLPSQMSQETVYAMSDLNQLVYNLQVELNMVKLSQTRVAATEKSNIVVNEKGELIF